MAKKTRTGSRSPKAAPRRDAALHLSQRRFAAAFQASPDAISITSGVDGTFVEVNDATVRLTGYSREELIGRANSDLEYWVNTGDRDRYLATLRTEGRVREMEAPFRTKSGEIRIGIISGEWIDVAGEAQILSLIRDVTDARRAEAALREGRERMAQAQRLAHVGFLDWDLRTNHIYFSEEACALTGVQPEGGLTTPEFVARSVHPDDLALVNDRLGRAIRNEEP